ncbi:MAG: CHAT domain-containing protein, partial [bacterium]|nr:CHAT domain-containing protein [bacterium]
DACQTAKAEQANPFGSVAARLIESGVGSVLAMSYSVLVEATRILTGAFYQALSQGATVGQAVDKARLRMLARTERGRLYRDGKEEAIHLRDWFLPALYQQTADRLHLPACRNCRRLRLRPQWLGRYRPDPSGAVSRRSRSMVFSVAKRSCCSCGVALPRRRSWFSTATAVRARRPWPVMARAGSPGPGVLPGPCLSLSSGVAAWSTCSPRWARPCSATISRSTRAIRCRSWPMNSVPHQPWWCGTTSRPSWPRAMPRLTARESRPCSARPAAGFAHHRDGEGAPRSRPGKGPGCWSPPATRRSRTPTSSQGRAPPTASSPASGCTMPSSSPPRSSGTAASSGLRASSYRTCSTSSAAIPCRSSWSDPTFAITLRRR